MRSFISRIHGKRKWTLTQWLRLGTQLLFLLIMANAIIRHRIGEEQGLAGPTNQSSSVDSLSPFGGLETLYHWATTGELLSHLHPSDLVLLVASVVLVVLLGSSFCGWICPFGTIQEWLYRLRTRFIPWKITVPAKVDRMLRYGRYVVLALALFFTYSYSELIFGDYCPWRAVWHLGSDEIAIGGAIVLGLVVVGGLLVERAWCRYACPLGAVLGIANKIAPVRLKRTAPACAACGLCNRQCPMDLDITGTTTVTDTTCNRCLTCVDSCPKPDALGLKVGWGARAKNLKGWIYGLAATAIFGGIIGLSMLSGYWQSTASATAPVADEATGLVSTEEIKGWRTLGEITKIWGVPQEILYRELELDPAEKPPETTKLKDLETLTTSKGVLLDRTYVVDIVTRWQNGELK